MYHKKYHFTLSIQRLLFFVFLLLTSSWVDGQCVVQSVNLQPYNNQNNTTQVFANNIIGIGAARISISHQLYGNAALSTNRISDTHYTGEYGINLGHDSGKAANFANRIETTLSFSTSVKDLKFTLNDVDAGDHIRLMVYDQNNNLIIISSANYSLYPNTVVNFQSISGSSGEFYENNGTDISSGSAGARKATVDFNFSGLYISKVVFQYYDPDGSGTYTIAKISGIDGSTCPSCNAGSSQTPITNSILTNF